MKPEDLERSGQGGYRMTCEVLVTSQVRHFTMVIVGTGNQNKGDGLFLSTKASMWFDDGEPYSSAPKSR